MYNIYKIILILKNNNGKRKKKEHVKGIWYNFGVMLLNAESLSIIPYVRTNK